jgi:kinesin family protein 1
VCAVQVIDLLDPKVVAERKKGIDVTSTLRVREHPELGPFADGKTNMPVSSADEALAAFRKGCKARMVSSTELSPESSRSHGQFCLTLTHGSNGNMSQLSIVDLGGTGQGEGSSPSKVGRAGKAAAAQHAEGSAINKSLAQLGMVMNALAQVKTAGKDKKVHVP